MAVILTSYSSTISIHAPLAGSDPALQNAAHVTRYFNPRSPCGERLATIRQPWGASDNFNPRSPCGERRKKDSPSNGFHWYFNPRSPCGERQLSLFHATVSSAISIHAPLAGSDPDKSGAEAEGRVDFNPRSPCGERRCVPGDPCHSGRYFNPRSPCGERQLAMHQADAEVRISIHAPLAGSDR